MGAGRIDVTQDAGVVYVVLNNPDKLNAMTWDMWVAFGDLWERLNVDDTVRCVVVKGAGERGFCPGNDIGEFETYRSNAADARKLSENMSRGRVAMIACPHPIIAQIKGACVGGGLEIAAMCDMRICTDDSRFGAPLNRIGLTMAYEELEPLWRLTDQATLFEFLVEGRIIGAAEAKEKRLVNRIVSREALEDEVAATVARIVAGPPLVNRWHKKFFNRLLDPRALAKEDYDEHYLAFETEDYKIGYKAFLEKKTPKFVGR
ncbi:MAG: enoyl-CoA hydratase-related protein [Pseudomonadota bacterium]